MQNPGSLFCLGFCNLGFFSLRLVFGFLLLLWLFMHHLPHRFQENQICVIENSPKKRGFNFLVLDFPNNIKKVNNWRVEKLYLRCFSIAVFCLFLLRLIDNAGNE